MKNRLPAQYARIRGATTLEAIVAFSLLSAVLSLATPLVVRHGRLLTSHRDYQLALEELSNQLDQVTALPEADLRKALERLSPSALTAEMLPGSKLQGELAPAEMGQRVTLSLSWDGPQGRTAPIRLTAWVFPRDKRPTDDLTKEGKR